jgi:hypothetical protein
MTLACATPTSFVFHQLDFSQGSGAFLTCLACGQPVSMDRWLGESCTGKRAEAALVARATVSLPVGAIACALCGEPVAIEPRHRDVVEGFGGTCDRCFGMVEAIGADPYPQALERMTA